MFSSANGGAIASAIVIAIDPSQHRPAASHRTAPKDHRRQRVQRDVDDDLQLGGPTGPFTMSNVIASTRVKKMRAGIVQREHAAPSGCRSRTAYK